MPVTTCVQRTINSIQSVKTDCHIAPSPGAACVQVCRQRRRSRQARLERTAPPCLTALPPPSHSRRQAGTGMKFDLAGETALVTGASGGLGLHFAGVLGRAGARVALVARRRAETERGAATLVKEGLVAIPVALDVTDAASVTAA